MSAAYSITFSDFDAIICRFGSMMHSIETDLNYSLGLPTATPRGTLPSNHDMAGVNGGNEWKFHWLEQGDCVRFP